MISVHLLDISSVVGMMGATVEVSSVVEGEGATVELSSIEQKKIFILFLTLEKKMRFIAVFKNLSTMPVVLDEEKNINVRHKSTSPLSHCQFLLREASR